MKIKISQQAARSFRLIVTLLCLPLSCPAGIVLNTHDSGPGSLRQALVEAAPGETITFAPSLAGATISLISGQLHIDRSVSVDASALTSPVTIDAGDAPNPQRVMLIGRYTTVRLDSLIITGGRTVDASHVFVPEYQGEPKEIFEPGDGGGIHNSGTLTVRHCVIRGNTTGRGGDLWVYGSPGGSGGGIHNAGDLTIEDTLITENSTGPGGLGIGTWRSWDDDDDYYDDDDDYWLTGRGGSGGPGAGIYNAGILLLKRCTISSNTTGPGGDGVDGPDGVYYNGDIESVIDGGFFRWSDSNYEDQDGDKVDRDDYEDSKRRIQEGGDGGPGGPGGGIGNEGDLIMEQCTIAGNTTGTGGEGASGLPGTGGSGAGLSQAHGSFFLDASTVSGNTTAWGEKFGGSGSGIFLSGGYCHLRNTTVAGNRTGDGGFRGGSAAGVFHFDGNLVLEHVTISNNTCGDGQSYPGGVGGLYTQDGNLTVRNSIIAGNMAGSGNPDYERWQSSVKLQGAYLGGNPRLAPLDFYGGLTRTMPPLAGSPVIDAGVALPEDLVKDQRGSSRPMGNGPDLGAVESGHAVGYDAWAASHFTDGTHSEFTADADGDGTSNAQVYACGADGTPTISHSGNEVLVSFGYRAEAQMDTVIKVMRSTDLKTFTEVLRIEGGESFPTDGCTLSGSPTRPVLRDETNTAGRAYYKIEVEFIE